MAKARMSAAAARCKASARYRRMTNTSHWRETSTANQGWVAEGRVQYGLLDLAGAHGGESIEDPCPVPSAGMIRIRFNGFALGISGNNHPAGALSLAQSLYNAVPSRVGVGRLSQSCHSDFGTVIRGSATAIRAGRRYVRLAVVGVPHMISRM